MREIINRIIFLVATFFPSVSIIGVPLRYVLIPLVIFEQRTREKNLLFLITGVVWSFYSIFSQIFGREFSLLDISYSLSFVCLFCAIVYCENRVSLVNRYVICFFFVNITYCVFQNLVLNSGLPSSWVLIHQNTHVDGYSIPLSYIPYLYRVTGLFNESVPFVIYLCFTYVYFRSVEMKFYADIALFFVVFSGAKVGIVFFLYAVVCRLFKSFSFHQSMILLFFGLVSMLLIFQNYFLSLAGTDPILYSIVIRLEGLFGALGATISSPEVLFFGGGFATTQELMLSNKDFARGTDFVGMQLYSNGVVGVLLMHVPIVLYFWSLRKAFDKEIKNVCVGFYLISIMLSGSYTFYAYSYLVVVLALSSSMKVKEVKNV